MLGVDPPAGRGDRGERQMHAGMHGHTHTYTQAYTHACTGTHECSRDAWESMWRIGRNQIAGRRQTATKGRMGVQGC